MCLLHAGSRRDPIHGVRNVAHFYTAGDGRLEGNGYSGATRRDSRPDLGATLHLNIRGLVQGSAFTSNISQGFPAVTSCAAIFSTIRTLSEAWAGVVLKSW